MSRPTSKVSKVLVAGPLAPFAGALKSRLVELGYTPLTTASVMRVVAHLSRWLDSGGMTAADLSSERVEQYFHERRAAGLTAFSTPRSLAHLFEVLSELGVLPRDQPAAPASGMDVLLSSFRNYLLNERALRPATAADYVNRARQFLVRRAADRGLNELTAGDVTSAVLHETAEVSVGSAQYFVVALRSFLRFCFVEGLVGSDLSAAALAVIGRRRSFLPQGISKSHADALLRSCDRRRPEGRRDYAIVITLLRLGLRASEVAALALEDIDWHAGELVVHGKGRREDRLPLPADVGGALVSYLRRGRPTTTTRREVFLRALAPIGPLGRGGVSSIVRRACVRAGVSPVGAHRLRHTLACQMVSSGVPLPEIGQVLRHRSVSSTAIYARVDLEALRSLAQPWPGSAAR
jgi:site-specific recombinase XerD